jgi:hypothetical protein
MSHQVVFVEKDHCHVHWLEFHVAIENRHRSCRIQLVPRFIRPLWNHSMEFQCTVPSRCSAMHLAPLPGPRENVNQPSTKATSLCLSVYMAGLTLLVLRLDY